MVEKTNIHCVDKILTYSYILLELNSESPIIRSVPLHILLSCGNYIQMWLVNSFLYFLKYPSNCQEPRVPTGYHVFKSIPYI